MRDNLYCSNDKSTISKKFGAHVESNSKSNRIPEVMKLSDNISSNNLDTVAAHMLVTESFSRAI